MIAVNDGDLFEKSLRRIQPPGVELKKETRNNTETTFLDVGIKMIYKKFQIRLWVKRDSERKCFILTVTSHQHAIFYSSISLEILRIDRADNTCSTFYNAPKTIIESKNKALNKLFG